MKQSYIEKYEFPRYSTNFVATLISKPKITLLISLLLVAFTLFGLTRLTADFTHAGYFHKDDKWLVEFDKFEQTFGNDDSIIIAVRNEEGLFNQVSLQLLDELTSAVWKLTDVIRVDSVTNYQRVFADGDNINVESLFSSETSYSDHQINELKEIALKDEMLSGYLLSEDATMTLLVGTLRPSAGDELDIKPVVNAARALLEQIEAKGHELHLVGAPLIVQSFAEASETDNAKIIPLLLLACILIMYYVLRNAWCVMYAMLVVILSAVGSLGIAGWLGVQMTSITTVLPQITIGIAVAGCLHILTVYRLSQKTQPNKTAAIEYALVKNTKPTLLTAITTSIGFISFCLSDIKTIAELGLVAAVSVFYVWCLTYLLLASLLLILPFGYNNKEPLRVSQNLLQKLVNNIANNRPYILGLYAVFIFVSLVGATMVRVDADPVGYFSQDHELRQGVDQIDEHIGSARNIEIMIDSGCENCAQKPEFLTKVAELEAFIEGRPEVSQVISIVDILKSTNRALNFGDEASYKVATTQTEIAQQLLFYTMGLPKGLSVDNRISSKQDSLRLTVFWTVDSSSKAIEEIALVEQKARHLGLNATITGKYSLYQRQESYVVNSFLSSVGIAFLLITVVLCVAFRSLKLSLVALLPNLTPLLVGGLGLWLMGESLNVGTVLVVSITLGIAVDDTLHIITEYQRQKQKGLTSTDTFTELFSETGIALYGTTLVLVFAFGASMISSFAPFQIFGALASTVLIAALAIDLTVLPAMMLPKKKASMQADESLTTSH
ncbi:efflux RND transporter permease subunit [Endozoicomonas ascidiicola]|uniref:efflux RND transporter permease subunit n=1 Tax=Endozoicomonas ascidiicola TaxID=1698521 RepID=UPI00082D1799|nr:MMPL family transporter [Endozoicomonas ascidiicola]